MVGKWLASKSACLDLRMACLDLRRSCDMPAEVGAGGVQCAVFVIPCRSVIGISGTAFLLMFNFLLF